MIARVAPWAVLDLALLLAASLSGVPAPWFGPAHAFLSIAALGQVRHCPDWRLPGGAILWMGAVFGPVGLLAARALRPLAGRLPHRLHLPAPDEPEEAAVHAVDLPVALPPDPASIGAMAPVFRHGRIVDRQAAIEAAVLSYEPRLSAIVAMGLTDEDQTIRALSASASTRAGQLLVDRRRRLERAIVAHDSLDDRLALAHLLADHGEHDRLLSPARRAKLRLEAAGVLGGILALLRHDDPRRPAALTLRHRMNPDEGDAHTLPLAAALDRLYRARDLPALARRCRAPDALALAQDDPLHDMVAYWRDAVPA